MKNNTKKSFFASLRDLGGYNLLSVLTLLGYLVSITVGPAIRLNRSNNPLVMADIAGKQISVNAYNAYVEDSKRVGLEYAETEEDYILFNLLLAEARSQSVIVTEQEITEYIKSLNINILSFLAEEKSLVLKSEREKIRSLIKDRILVQKIEAKLGFPAAQKDLELQVRLEVAKKFVDASIIDLHGRENSLSASFEKEDLIADVEYIDLPIVSQFSQEELLQQAHRLYQDSFSTPSFNLPERRTAYIYYIPENERSAFEKALHSKDPDMLIPFVIYQKPAVLSQTYEPNNTLDIIFSLKEGEYHTNYRGDYILLKSITPAKKLPFEAVEAEIMNYLVQEEQFYFEKRCLQQNAELFEKAEKVHRTILRKVDSSSLHPLMQERIFQDGIYSGSILLLDPKKRQVYTLSPQIVRIFRVKKIYPGKPIYFTRNISKIRSKMIQDIIAQNLDYFMSETSEEIVDLSENTTCYPKEVIKMILLGVDADLHFYLDESNNTLYVFRVKEIISPSLERGEDYIGDLIRNPPQRNKIVQRLWKKHRVESSKFKPDSI